MGGRWIPLPSLPARLLPRPQRDRDMKASIITALVGIAIVLLTIWGVKKGRK